MAKSLQATRISMGQQPETPNAAVIVATVYALSCAGNNSSRKSGLPKTASGFS